MRFLYISLGILNVTTAFTHLAVKNFRQPSLSKRVRTTITPTPTVVHVVGLTPTRTINENISNPSRARPLHNVQLQLSPSACDSILAFSTIASSSAIGFTSDRMKFFGGNAGTIVTLISAAIFSNIGIWGLAVPKDHFIYDICWTKLLPASLALVLLSTSKSSSMEETEASRISSNSSSSSSSTNREIITACAIPFLIGSAGSIIGCFMSAKMLMGCNAMKPFEAAIAAGCLCASYIGGSVNFFAAANIISKDMKSIFGSGSPGGEHINNLLSAMATADLLVMAIYFGGLSAILSWKRLGLIFPGRHHIDTSMKYGDNDNSSAKTENGDKEVTTHASIPISKERSKSMVLSAIALFILTSSIVELSILIEKGTARFIPGMGCASVAVLGTLTNKVLNNLCRDGNDDNHSGQFTLAASKFRSDLKTLGPSVSQYCFLALFGSIGISANLGSAISQSASSITLAILALIVHVMTIGAGSFAFMKLVPINRYTRKILPLSAEEVLVSSNAGIGGATTAAAFAGNLSDNRVSAERKRGLIFAGTVWGVVGYAFATPIGVTLTKILANRLVK